MLTITVISPVLSKTFDEALRHSTDPPTGAQCPGRVEAAKRRAFENLGQARYMLHSFEIEHSISERWAPDSQEYKFALKNINTHKCQKALEKLESLVVQRLFEMGLSGTDNLVLLFPHPCLCIDDLFCLKYSL